MSEPTQISDIGEIDLSKLISLITDPKTGKIYYEPVIINEGTKDEQIVEKLEYLKDVVSRDEMIVFKKFQWLKTLINDLSEVFPELSTMRYVEDDEFKKTLKYKYILNQSYGNQMLVNMNLDEIKKFSEFHIDKIPYNTIINLIRYFNSNGAKNTILKHILDNCVDINADLNTSGYYSNIGWSLLNRASHDKNEELVRYLLSKDSIDVMHKCPGDGWTPLHQVSNFCKQQETLKMMIDKGADPFAKNNEGREPLLNILYKEVWTFETVKYVFRKMGEWRSHYNFDYYMDKTTRFSMSQWKELKYIAFPNLQIVTDIKSNSRNAVLGYLDGGGDIFVTDKDGVELVELVLKHMGYTTVKMIFQRMGKWRSKYHFDHYKPLVKGRFGEQQWFHLLKFTIEGF